MNGGLKTGYNAGFTIIEVMIVLAVSGALFVSAALLIGGKQNGTEFTQAAGQIQSQIQQSINNVINGYYPQPAKFSCTGSNGTTPNITTGNNALGTNGGCVFFGQMLQFAVGGTKTGGIYTSPTVDTYPIVGSQNTINGTPAQTLSSASPVLLTSNVSSISLEYGLSVVCMVYYATSPSGSTCSGSGTAIGAVAFASSAAGTQATVGSSTGSQEVDVVPVPDASLGHSAYSSTQLNLAYDATNYGNPAYGISICLKSGGTSQTALLTIGNDNVQTTVNLAIEGSNGCS